MPSDALHFPESQFRVNPASVNTLYQGDSISKATGDEAVHVIRHDSPASLLAHGGELLRQAEAQNNLILGICAHAEQNRAVEAAPPWWLTIENGGTVSGVTVMTPPYSLVISPMVDAAIQSLAGFLQDADAPIPGVAGPSAAASAFAEVWSRATGQSPTLQMDQRLYACERVEPIRRPAAGSAWPNRTTPNYWRHGAVNSKLRLGGKTMSPRAKDMMQRQIAAGSVFVWDDGRPVSCAAFARETENGVAVNFVFTPRELRGRGYATSCVAALTQRLLDRGKIFCCLYTDLANPTSNGIYQRIGYRPVCDAQVWKFGGN